MRRTFPAATAIWFLVSLLAAGTAAAQQNWDPSMQVECIRDVNNGPIDVTECSIAGGHNWLSATDSPQIIPNATGLATYQSFPQADGSFVGRLTNDNSAYVDPLGEDHFLWLTFMDHSFYHGTAAGINFGQTIKTSVSINYNDWVPPGYEGIARGFIGFGADDGVTSWALEIDCNHINWGDAHPDPKYINVPPYSTFGMYFAHLWGPAWGTYCEKLSGTDIALDATALFRQTAIDNPTNFPVPPSGWGSLQLRAVMVGTETYRKAIADLWFARLHYWTE